MSVDSSYFHRQCRRSLYRRLGVSECSGVWCRPDFSSASILLATGDLSRGAAFRGSQQLVVLSDADFGVLVLMDHGIAGSACDFWGVSIRFDNAARQPFVQGVQ